MKLFLIFIFIVSSFGLSIPEASGICEKGDKFFVVNDEGKIYLVQNDNIIKKIKFKNADFEGIECGQKYLYVVVEDRCEIWQLTYDFKIKKKIKLKIKNYSKAHGIEGIAKSNGKFYISIQNKKSIYVFKKDKFLKKIKIGIKDISGIDIKNGILYFVSDKEDKLYFYDLQKEKIIKIKKLPKISTEGIVKIKNGFYLANDDGDIRPFYTKDK